MLKYIFICIVIISTVGLYAQDEIVFFRDSPNGDEIYDSSWGFFTSPSQLELIGEKFPVDPDHPYSGAHSLRMRWTSNTGGDWGLGVASVGWVGHNVTDYDSIIYMINGPDSIKREDLPDIELEDLSNKNSSKVWLGDYFDGVDDDTLTWQEVRVPLNAFSPGSEGCDFTRIKVIFHWQRAADGMEHVAWLDEIRIIKEGGGGNGGPVSTPKSLVVEGAEKRIDLRWKANQDSALQGYYVYRASSLTGPYARVNSVVHNVNLYSDFIGENDLTYFYYVTAADQSFNESDPSDTLSSSTYQMTDDQLLTSVQESTFRYFYDYGHPVSGLARERKNSGNTCTSGGTGMGLITMMVGAERNFEPRDSIATQVLKILTFLQDITPRYYGVWAHWINGETGETIPFSQFDDGGDLIETAFLIQGILTIRQYFDLDNSVENEIRQRATEMWESVEWDWYLQLPGTDGTKLYWHWSPNYGWQMNMPITGFNEGMIAYLLAIASPTHSVPASLYYDGWASSLNYANGNDYYGYHQWVGWPHGGPLFFTHYSYLGFDPRDKSDIYCNYFDNNRNISLINRAYCMENPNNYVGYSALVWGLTASDNPWGYFAHEPKEDKDNGTITPTAAISAMPYIPDESIATLKHFYHTYGPDLWGEFGFRDAFNLNENWFATSYIAIDQGTIVPMIENYRTQLCWNEFMSNPEITAMLDSIGWVTAIEEEYIPVASRYYLKQNYPNPFNPETTISFALLKSGLVDLKIYNLLGEQVAVIYENRHLKAGEHKVTFNAKNLSSGVYFYSLKANDFYKTRKMLMVK